MMRAAIWTGPRQMTVAEVPAPAPGPGEVCIQVSAVGICGSELSGYLGHNSLRVPPLVMGHEFSGTVSAVGHGVSAIAPGDRVTVNPLIGCGRCPMCRRGLENLCPGRQIVGIHRPGAFAQWVSVPERSCFRLPHGVGDVTGALAEPLACSLRAVRLAGVGVTDTVVVFGAGAIGLFALAAARRAGAGTVAVVDTNPRRLAGAQEWGADLAINPREHDPVAALQAATGGLGADSAIDAVGLPVTRRQAVQAVRPGGAVIFSGLHEDAVELPGNTVVRSEIQIRGSFCYSWDDFGSALRLLAAGVAPPSPQWLDERPLAAAQPSFDELVDSGAAVAKIVLRPQT